MTTERSRALLYRGTPEDGDVAVYNATTKKWEPQVPPAGTGAVDSVNGDTGTVVLDAGDIGADPTGLDNTDGTDVQSVIADLDAAISAGSGASGPSSLLDIPGCVLYLDASTLDLDDGDPVALWPDLSPSGFDAAQAVADNQPVFKAGIQNGLGVVRFDPSVDPQFLGLSGAGLSLFRNKTAITVVSVIRAPVGAGQLLSAGLIGTGDPIFEHFSHGFDLLTVMYDTSFSDSFGPSRNRYGSGGAADPSTFGYVGVMAADMATGSFCALTSLFANTGGQGWGVSPPYHMPDVAATAVNIGADYLVANPWEGDVGVLGVWDRPLNATECRQAFELMASAWATQ